jgi:Concanavalin A-like lectin/glucanases superfamily
LKVHAGEPLYIGRKGTSEPYFFFNGAIDDVRIYGRALTDAEVLSLCGEGGFEPQQQLGLPEWIRLAMRRMWLGLGR